VRGVTDHGCRGSVQPWVWLAYEGAAAGVRRVTHVASHVMPAWPARGVGAQRLGCSPAQAMSAAGCIACYAGIRVVQLLRCEPTRLHRA
jgi:hypothetical protein